MTSILKILLDKFEQNQEKIDQFFARKFKNPLFYNSVDLRHSGFKIAPIDVNCFPAGSNNLSEASRETSKILADEFLSHNFPGASKIAILSENHTRNLKYLENALTLQKIIAGDGKRKVKIVSLIEEIKNTLEINLENGQKISIEKLIRNGNKITTQNDFEPHIIISNNDFTHGVDEILKNIDQPIMPSTNLGWHLRKKSVHFDIYNQITEEFCQIIDLDPWLISTAHRNCENVNFKAKIGVGPLAQAVDDVIFHLKEKYKQYGIESDPYCYVKADNGTYGMAVMTVKSGAEILEINKKNRNKMNSIKGSIQNTTAIIQEGVPTRDLVKNIIAEPLIYLIGGKVAGNLFRVNGNRDKKISLNAAGMEFYDINNVDENDLDLGLKKEEVTKVYEVIAKLSALASSQESY
ncbi:MAG: glutamate--cysteine ligase [Rickettsiales bacterium]|jgi:glutamate--cysteine ligase